MARILIVEDDEHARDSLRRTLHRAGYEIVTAENGKKGMELYRASPTDLIITDIMMPERDGLEVLKELGREFPGLKCIAISGGGRRVNLDVLDLARRLGATRTLEKPITVSKLLETVREVLGERAS